MKKYLEKSARTVDDAIAAALAELRLEREDVEVEVLQRPKSGFLGFGAAPAVIRAAYEVPDEPAPAPVREERPAPAKVEKPVKPAEPAEPVMPAEPKEPVTTEKPKTEKPEKAEKPARAEKPRTERPKTEKPKTEKPPKAEKPVVTLTPEEEEREAAEIRAFLEGLLEHMGLQAEIRISRRDNGGVSVELSGDNMGAIIGRRGETLDAIQHLTNYAVNKGNDKHMHISVDAEGYRSKREDALAASARKMAEKVLKYKRSMAFEPMNSYERHVIHTALQDVEGVTTSSTGVEPNRRVVVSYVKPDKPEAPKSNKPQSREWA